MRSIKVILLQTFNKFDIIYIDRITEAYNKIFHWKKLWLYFWLSEDLRAK